MEEVKPGKMKATLKRLSPGAAFCAAPAGGVGGADVSGSLGGGTMGAAELFGSITFAEAFPLTLAFAAFLAVGMWMFRRWGNTPAPQAPLEEPPVVEATEACEEERERELVNV
ncbi:MAG: hypothetical protein M3494_01495 [Actinomycetota bacterium]|jgi:hypothetical protein|nr:hypothetical protein [Actinomycetota bacterium]